MEDFTEEDFNALLRKLEDTVKYFNSFLEQQGLTIFCAESMTAGLLSSSIGSISGASAILKGSIVTYSREIKTRVLEVDPLLIDKYTAESQEVTSAMAIGLTKLYPTANLYVAVTGVASIPPAGSAYEVIKKEGQTYVAVYYQPKEGNEKLYERQEIVNKSGGRKAIQVRAVIFILESVLDIINRHAEGE